MYSIHRNKRLQRKGVLNIDIIIFFWGGKQALPQKKRNDFFSPLKGNRKDKSHFMVHFALLSPL